MPQGSQRAYAPFCFPPKNTFECQRGARAIVILASLCDQRTSARIEECPTHIHCRYHRQPQHVTDCETNMARPVWSCSAKWVYRGLSSTMPQMPGAATKPL